MSKAFIYGKMVEGDNFTDRVKETRRLKANFEEGINTIVISPRRIGKSSLIKRVKDSIDNPMIKVVMMDIYDCRSEYDFLNRFAAVLMKEAAGRMERVLDTIQKFLGRVVPKVSYSPAPLMDYSISLGITPQNYSPEEILALPEIIAREQGVQIVVCIDEFQQVGEFPDSITVQKRMRGVWQRQQDVSYCMYGSKKHMMTRIFQNKRMPFYQFGEITYLDKIPREDWVNYIVGRFSTKGKTISDYFAGKICDAVDGYSSYVQQLAWDVMQETESEVTEESFANGMEALLDQNAGLFTNQTETLTSYQMNLLRAICSGIHDEYTSKAVTDVYNLGTKSNIVRIKTSLAEKEIIDVVKGKAYISDPVFELWFRREYL